MQYKQVFTWDPQKAESNIRKHGIDFETAVGIFTDPNVISMLERIENGEERWQSVGMTEGLQILLVAHTIMMQDDAGDYVEQIRVISARKADRTERKAYDNGYF